MKIAYYVTCFPKLTETFVLREMIFLRQMGIDVQVFSMTPLRPTPVMHSEAETMMAHAHYSPFVLSRHLVLAQLHFLVNSPIRYIVSLLRVLVLTYREPKVFIGGLVLFPKAVYFARQLQEQKFDHIHSHFAWINSVAARVAADLTGISATVHVHAFDLFARDRESIRRQLRATDGIVTISEYHRRYISDLCPSWPPERIRVVHCGLNPAEFTPAHVPSDGGTARILSVGSLFEKKGHEYLIDACAALAAKGCAFRCTIVGSGTLQKSLQARIDKYGLQKQVRLAGPKDQREVRRLYNHSDVFVLPCVIARRGDRDGTPVVLMEAMAMQLPVITTPVTGNCELVHDGENGLIVPERNSAALALAIDRLINDPALRSRLGERARRTVLREYDISKTAARMAAIFEAMQASRHARADTSSSVQPTLV